MFDFGSKASVVTTLWLQVLGTLTKK